MTALALFGNEADIMKAAQEYAKRELPQYGEVDRAFLAAQVSCTGQPHLWYVDLHFKGFNGVITTQIPLRPS